MYELDHTPEQERDAIQAAQEFSDYLKALARQRRVDPQDDLITALAFAEAEGDKLTEDELVSTCILLLNAGHEAVVNAVGNGFNALFQHPARWDWLKKHPEGVETAIEELMRYDTPLQLFRRWVLTDLEYAGIALKKGDQVGLMFGAANRDPAVFTAPDTLDLQRTPNPHITFGSGVHFCLGAPLARMELTIIYRTLIQRLPDLRPIEAPVFHPTYVIRGLKALHVAF